MGGTVDISVGGLHHEAPSSVPGIEVSNFADLMGLIFTYWTELIITGSGSMGASSRSMAQHITLVRKRKQPRCLFTWHVRCSRGMSVLPIVSTQNESMVERGRNACAIASRIGVGSRRHFRAVIRCLVFRVK